MPISEIDDFPDHPFKVKIDEDMDMDYTPRTLDEIIEGDRKLYGWQN